MGNIKQNRKPPAFDPEGSGYDYEVAKRVGMTDENLMIGPQLFPTGRRHFGSVALTTREQQEKFNLPKESYIILKGRQHETFDKAVEGERKRGFIVKKIGNRYFSIPRMKR